MYHSLNSPPEEVNTGGEGEEHDVQRHAVPLPLDIALS